jgi:transcriptional regulator with XRE-family HTH domain
VRIRTTHDLAVAARARRAELGLTQAEAAARARVSRKWVSDFETGKATVDLATALRLLEALGVVVEAHTPAAGRPGGGPRRGAAGTAAARAGDSDAGGPVDLDDVLDRYLRR